MNVQNTVFAGVTVFLIGLAGGCGNDDSGDYPALLRADEMDAAVGGPVIAVGGQTALSGAPEDLIASANAMRRRADALRSRPVIEPALRERMRRIQITAGEGSAP